ncbi:hypothetical protein I302_102822 [Kwoniella bestiolae CBS 10118]|uniref:C-CAP/cofactor C-like domain-containing protein n=1 Tax=Kwoniella bestiolae CBS 10118 TaxID=1296100 RepID=A0A1B9GG18_9TREE|nr:hypothetical protein I302_01517 [Kwoniella bestiolae CBS 10118]OCF30000.1 hypothetical protein I302_01517 [Kwoniella bestiolae CBS 10118]
MSNISIAQAEEFHAHFHKQRQDIQGFLDSSNLSELNARISALRGEVDQVSALIPVYDRVKYDKQLSELEQAVSSRKVRDKPKSKFSFKGGSGRSTPAPKPENGSTTSAPIHGSTVISTSSNIVGDSSIPTPAQASSSSSSNNIANSHTISNLSHQLVRPPEDVRGTYTLSLSDLSDCIIDLRPPGDTSTSSGKTESEVQAKLTAIHGKTLRRCILISPVVKGSILLDGVEGCLLVLGSQQFRIHTSTDTTILLHVDSLPVIEHCSNLLFGGYPSNLLENTIDSIPIQRNTNYRKVQDFDWPLPSPSPNWSALSDQESAAQNPTVRLLVDKLEGVRSSEDVDRILEESLPLPRS